MSQLAITYAPVVDQLCGARRSDPLSSHEADERHRKSGRAGSHGHMVRALLSAEGASLTSHELSDYLPFNSAEVGRRLADDAREDVNITERVGVRACWCSRCRGKGPRLTEWRLV